MTDKRLSIIIALLLLSLSLLAGEPHKQSLVYAEKEGEELMLDLYSTDTTTLLPRPCLVFVFGGGFKDGERDAALYKRYFTYFANRGFTVASIDYRLGMKGQKAPGMLGFKPLLNAIHMAVEDLYTATNYLLENAEKLHIDPSRIIISGSSAGAITVLQADYMERDHHPLADMLPDDFRYAGVISFAGGIFSREGVPSYTERPAPTLFFHGSADRLVPYDKTRLFHLGMFGTKSLAARFRDERYPYMFYSMEDMGHEVSEYPMNEYLPEIEHFITDFVFDRKQWMTDVTHKDMLRKPENSDTPENYYN